MLTHVNGWLTAEQLVSRLFAAQAEFVASGGVDEDALAEAIHPEVVLHEPASLPYAGDWEGLAGAAALLRAMGDVWSEFRVADVEAARRGDTVFLAGTLHMRARATGAAIDQPFAQLLHFKDDLLVDATPFYFDTGEILTVIR
jgi:ketosteroid isomerase-like protein